MPEINSKSELINLKFDASILISREELVQQTREVQLQLAEIDKKKLIDYKKLERVIEI